MDCCPWQGKAAALPTFAPASGPVSFNPNSKSKSSAAQSHRERTPLACGFRRLAENLVPQTFSRQNRTKKVRRRFGRAAQTGTRAAYATILISEFGLKSVTRPLLADDFFELRRHRRQFGLSEIVRIEGPIARGNAVVSSGHLPVIRRVLAGEQNDN